MTAPCSTAHEAPASNVDSPPPSANREDSAPVDWAAVLAQFDGRREFVGKLADIAVRAHSGLPEKIARAVLERDLPALGFLAHGVKGLCASFHAPGVLALASETEGSVRDGDAATAFARAGLLVARLQDMIENIALWRQGNGQVHE